MTSPERLNSSIIWSEAEFLKKIWEAALGNGPEYGSLPSSIAVGNLVQTEFDALRILTGSTVLSRERLRCLKARRGDGHVSFCPETSTGPYFRSEVRLPNDLTLDESKGPEGEILCGDFHSHSINHTFSSSDMMHLFLKGDSYQFFACGVCTPTHDYLLVRSQETPWISLEEQQNLNTALRNEFESTIRAGEARPGTLLGAISESILAVFQGSKWKEYVAEVKEEFIKNKSKLYSMGYYVKPKEATVFERVS